MEPTHAPLLECIPNVSEGRDPLRIEKLITAITQIDGVQLLHRDSGYDANRTVFTFVGPPQQVARAAKSLAACARGLIDLTDYAGTHPFVGALDVCPFVPLFGLPMRVAQQVAVEVGTYIGSELQIPVYLYEASATRPLYRSLAEVRRGGLSQVALRRRTSDTDPGEGPDFGPNGIHPTAGASVVGARNLLVAYNINLTTTDQKIARKIARGIRTSGRGLQLPAVRAIGWFQEQFGCAQVSVNLIDYRTTGMATAYEAVRRLAREAGTDVAGSELIGLAPLEALVSAGRYYQPTAITDDAAVSAAVKYLGLDALKPFNAQERVLEWAIS